MKLKVLCACEESQAVCKEFRKLGHEAYSCDIIECSGGHPEWHIQDDVLKHMDGWDLIIAFPPCTYLSGVGTRQYSLKCNSPEKVQARLALRKDAFNFFMKIAEHNCKYIAIENPVGYINTHYRKPDQIIHPYYFGDPFQKRTCLWLKNLPVLEYTNVLEKPEPLYICKGEKCKGKKIGWVEGIKGTGNGKAGLAKARSKTFPGIARAMAEQWSKYIIEQEEKA